MVYTVSLKYLRKLDKWKTKYEVSSLKETKKNLQQMSSIWKSCPKNRKKIQQSPDTGPQRHIWPCPPTVCWNLVRNGLIGRFAFKKPTLRKETRKKMLKYAELDKNITSSSHCECIQRRSGEKFNSECLQLSVKHTGDSLMVWDCISACSIGDLVKTDGITKSSALDFDP